jgi:hypothetical protein
MLSDQALRVGSEMAILFFNRADRGWPSIVPRRSRIPARARIRRAVRRRLHGVAEPPVTQT